jgi:hypothetical protein
MRKIRKDAVPRKPKSNNKRKTNSKTFETMLRKRQNQVLNNKKHSKTLKRKNQFI